MSFSHGVASLLLFNFCLLLCAASAIAAQSHDAAAFQQSSRQQWLQRKLLAVAQSTAAAGALECRCPSDFDPVCGSDGEVHSNTCRARCNGIVPVGVPLVSSLGNCIGLGAPCRTCHPVPAWSANSSAAVSAASACGCTDFAAPVCGADNTTYANRCWARCANVTDFIRLPTAAAASGAAGAAAVPGAPCAHPEVKPDWKPCASASHCANRQHLYPSGPVCGSDGLAYAGRCEAECAGVTAVREAPQGAQWMRPCPPAAAPTPSKSACGCSDTVDPVCVVGGGYLYRNACEARCGNATVVGKPAAGQPPLRSSCPRVAPGPVLLPVIVADPSRPVASG